MNFDRGKDIKAYKLILQRKKLFQRKFIFVCTVIKTGLDLHVN